MQQMDQQMNRQQKIMAAKASFRQTGDNAGFFYRGDFKGNSFEGAGPVEEENPQTPVFHFGLVRFMASLMLLLLLLAAFFLSGLWAGVCPEVHAGRVSMESSGEQSSKGLPECQSKAVLE